MTKTILTKRMMLCMLLLLGGGSAAYSQEASGKNAKPSLESKQKLYKPNY